MSNRREDTTKLGRLAAEQGITVKELLEKAFAENVSTARVAKALGVYPISIDWWLMSNGYAVEKTAKLVKRPLAADENVTMPAEATPEAAY